MRDFGYSFPFFNWLSDSRDVFGHTHVCMHTCIHAHTHAGARHGPRGDEEELWQWEVKPTLLNIQLSFLLHRCRKEFQDESEQSKAGLIK